MITHARTLGLSAIAGAALLAFAGTATATQLTSPAGTVYTGSVHAESSGSIGYDTPFGPFECTSGTLAGSIGQHGAGVTVKATVTAQSFTGCSPSVTVKPLKGGTMEIHHVAGSNNGTVTSSGYEIELFFNQFGLRCVYSSNNTHVGTLTGSGVTGGTAVLDIAAALPRTGGTVLCPGQGTWTGQYKITTPDSLLVDA